MMSTRLGSPDLETWTRRVTRASRRSESWASSGQAQATRGRAAQAGARNPARGRACAARPRSAPARAPPPCWCLSPSWSRRHRRSRCRPPARTRSGRRGPPRRWRGRPARAAAASRAARAAGAGGEVRRRARRWWRWRRRGPGRDVLDARRDLLVRRARRGPLVVAVLGQDGERDRGVHPQRDGDGDQVPQLVRARNRGGRCPRTAPRRRRS